jgi:hypothetical protein
VSVSKAVEYTKGSLSGDSAPTITTAKEILTPFQAERVILISKLRELGINGRSPLAIQAGLGISQRQYYRLYQKAFEHDCKLIEQWDSDIFREDLAVYKARQEKVLSFLMDKMEDANAHDITRLKAAQLALELSNEIFRSSYQGVLDVKKEAIRDLEKFDSRYPLQTFLIKNDIVCNTVAQYKKAQRQLDKEEKQRKKKKRI